MTNGTVNDNGTMYEAIARDAEVMHGTPVFRGMRVPVRTLFEYLEHGDSLDDFLHRFPAVSRELAVQVPSSVRIHKLTVLAKAEVVRSLGSVSDADRESLNLVLCRAFCPRTGGK